jgi:hypothetical protein
MTNEELLNAPSKDLGGAIDKARALSALADAALPFNSTPPLTTT